MCGGEYLTLHLLLVLMLGLHVVDTNFGNVNVGNILDLIIIELLTETCRRERMRVREGAPEPRSRRYSDRAL